MFDSLLFSPIRRKLFDPLFALGRRSPLIRHWKELEETQFLPEKELRERQWRSLESLLRYVMENNPFYRARFRKAGIVPGRIRQPDDLCLIPVLTKDVMRGIGPGMLSAGYDLSRLLHFKTGGSTGKALDIYITEQCSELRNACARRHDRWSGWEVGEPIAAVWGNPHLPVRLLERVKNSLVSPFIYLDTMEVTDASILNFVAQWERVKPTLLFGHAHSLYLLARHLRRLTVTAVRPKGILSTSMMLMCNEREEIEEFFGVRVTNRYGCEEVSLISSECEKHDGMHLNIEHLFVEFVKDDGTHAGAGESGRVVVTDLFNLAFPLVRYEVGDVGVPSGRKCPCGRGLPLMEHVTGRVADFLVGKDGARIAGVSLIENTLTRYAGIVQMRIIQQALDLIELHLVVDEQFTVSVQKALVGYFQDLFQDGAEIRVSFSSALLPEGNGKFRFSVCRVPDETVGPG